MASLYDFQVSFGRTYRRYNVLRRASSSQADFLAMADDEDVEHANVMAAFLQWDANGILASVGFRVRF